MPLSDNQPRKVMILTASVGAGHNQAARAIKAVLEESPEGLQVELVDVLRYVPWAFRLFYAGGYSVAVSRLPKLYGLGFRLTDRPDGPGRNLTELRRLWTERLAMRPLARLLRQSRPDLIVHTHFLAPPMVGRLRSRGQLDCPQVVVVTDVGIHRYWYSEQVEHWFLPAPPSADRLARWGVPAHHVTVAGMPVHPKWLQTYDLRQVRAEWRLPGERPIVLLAGGADFVCGPVVEVARELAAQPEGPCVVVLGGRNKALLGRLAGLKLPADRLVPMAFTDRAQELAAVASLMITKAGMSTVAECLARGLPMVFLPPVPGQEAGNAAYVSQAGAGAIGRDTHQVLSLARRLLLEPQTLEAMSKAGRSLYLPGAQTIAAAIRERVRRTDGR